MDALLNTTNSTEQQQHRAMMQDSAAGKFAASKNPLADGGGGGGGGMLVAGDDERHCHPPTVLTEPNVVYNAQSHAEGLGAPVNISVVVPPAPSGEDMQVALLGEIDRIVTARTEGIAESQKKNTRPAKGITQIQRRIEDVVLWILYVFFSGLFCTMFYGLLYILYAGTQSYWAEYNHGERSFAITFIFWTGQLLCLFLWGAVICWTSSGYSVACTAKTQTMWSNSMFRGAMFLLVAICLAPLAATAASVLARDEVFVGAGKHENFPADNFVGRFVALYTWVLFTAQAGFGLWKLPCWIADYTRPPQEDPAFAGTTQVGDTRLSASAAEQDAVRDHLSMLGQEELTDVVLESFKNLKLQPTEWMTELMSMEQDGSLETFIEACGTKIEQDKHSDQERLNKNALVVAELQACTRVAVFCLWILPLLAAVFYSYIQCDANCDRGTCSGLFWGTCSECTDDFIGEFCQFAPAYRFENCR